VTGAITSGLPGGNAFAGTTPKNSKTTPADPTKAPKPPTTRAGVVSSSDTSPDSTQADSTDTPSWQATTKPTTMSIPKVASQLPLTALDVLKAEIPAVAAAIPLPGMSALPAIADAIITPLQQAVKSFANAASGLPFMQIDLNQVTPATSLSTNRFIRTAPAPEVKPKSSGPDPLPRDNELSEEPAVPLKAPLESAKPKQTFSASSHFDTASDFRPGYPDYLRAAGMSEVAAVAVPGFAGILTITCAGGLLGYRQARAGRSTAPSRAARFVS